MTSTTTAHITDLVKRKYGKIAELVASGLDGSCCGPSASGCGGADPITGDLYDPGQVRDLPPDAPHRLARVRQSNRAGRAQTGRDGARPRVGRRHRRLAVGPACRSDRQGLRSRHDGPDVGLGSREPAHGRGRERGVSQGTDRGDPAAGCVGGCDHLELRHQSVGRQGSRARRAWRVLRPGGRLAVSDVVRRRAVPEALRRSLELWVGCVAGALEESDYRARLAAAGFVEIEVEPTRIYRDADAGAFLEKAGFDPHAVAAEVDGAFMSAFVRATRPPA